MSRVVRWTSESKKTFNQNLAYLSTDWSNQVINDFLDKVEDAIKRIGQHPDLYPVHDKNLRIHKCVIHKRIILYYRIVDEFNVDLLTFWNTYQNPDSLEV
jgi:plasmid stabilization system protein ParE